MQLLPPLCASGEVASSPGQPVGSSACPRTRTKRWHPALWAIGKRIQVLSSPDKQGGRILRNFTAKITACESGRFVHSSSAVPTLTHKGQQLRLSLCHGDCPLFVHPCARRETHKGSWRFLQIYCAENRPPPSRESWEGKCQNTFLEKQASSVESTSHA